MNKENNNINQVITDAIKKITEISDVNMIVGTPIVTASGSTVIPISKITLGFLSGGGEYGEVKIFKPKSKLPHSGASGGVVNVKPSGFLVEKKGSFKYIHCPNDVFEKAYDTCEELIKNINGKNSKI